MAAKKNKVVDPKVQETRMGRPVQNSYQPNSAVPPAGKKNSAVPPGKKDNAVRPQKKSVGGSMLNRSKKK